MTCRSVNPVRKHRRLLTFTVSTPHPNETGPASASGSAQPPPSRHTNRARFASLPGSQSAPQSAAEGNRIAARIGGPFPTHSATHRHGKTPSTAPHIGPALAMLCAAKEGMTSDSSQGLTADRVLIHVDTELGAKDLLNNRMAYVAVSRGAYDA